jgi:hypothetical protein
MGKDDVEYKAWNTSGLEFEYQVARKIETTGFTVHGEYSFEQSREIAELTPKQGDQFVSRSCDLTAVHPIDYQVEDTYYLIVLKLFVECKYARGRKFLFLPPFAFDSQNTANITYYLPYMGEISSTYNMRTFIPSFIRTIGKGIFTGKQGKKQEMDILTKARNQACLACIDYFSQDYMKFDPLFRLSGEVLIKNYFNLVPIIVTNGKLFFRDYDKTRYAPSKSRPFDDYFTEFPYGVILFSPPNFMKRYMLSLLQKYSKRTQEFSLDPTLDDVNEFNYPSRCFIVTYNSIDKFLRKYRKEIEKQSRLDLDNIYIRDVSKNK